MKTLQKIQTTPEGVDFALEWKSVSPRSVQGGTLYALAKDALYVESGGRYKLFCDGTDFVKILEGSGHFKWARGETPFSENDVFCIQQAEEYEINGRCRFAVVRK